MQNQPPQAAKTDPFDPDRMWYGHLPCVWNSTSACEWHKERDHFFNPFLPPNAPMKLRRNGGQWHIVEPIDTSGKQRKTSRPIAFLQTLPSKIRKLLTPIFPFTRNDKASKDESSHDLQKSNPDELQAPEEHSEPPPQYSTITKLIPNVPYYPGQAPQEACLDAKDTLPYVWGSNLPFDAASFETLAPMHPSMRYHLAFYHLHTARRVIESLGLENNILAIPDLCCVGGPSPLSCPNYISSNEIYYDSGQFLQKQEITYSYGFDPEGIKITMCPHFTSSLWDVKMWVESDWQHEWLRASAWISHKPHLSYEQITSLRSRPDPYDENKRCNPHNPDIRRIRWKSAKGRLADVFNCEFCHCSLERSLEVREQTLDVRFTVYRILGTGVDRFEPKWNSLLTGSSSMRPPREGHETHDVYRQVLRVAHSLGMERLYWPTFRTPYGDWTALPSQSEADNVPSNKVKPLTMNWQSLCQ